MLGPNTERGLPASDTNVHIVVCVVLNKTSFNATLQMTIERLEETLINKNHTIQELLANKDKRIAQVGL